MSDHPPFVPPSSATSPGSPPPPTGPLLPGPPPRRPRRRALTIAVAVGASFLGLALLIGAGVLAVSAIDGLLQDGRSPIFADPEGDHGDGTGPRGDQAWETGDPASPVAVSPLDCEACFGSTQLGDVIPGEADFAAIGLEEIVEMWGDYPAYESRLEHEFQVAAWNRELADSDACFFTYPTSPVGPTPDTGVPDAGDTVEYLGLRSDLDGFNTVTQAARLLASSSDAIAYMSGLYDALSTCRGYELASGWAPEVEPAPAFDVPDDVAAVGWIESSYGDRLYVIDLQRGNLVVRTSVWSSWDGPTAAEVTEFVESLARRLSELPVRG